jgi:hypothetical protein
VSRPRRLYRLEADAEGPTSIAIEGQTITGPVHLAAGAHSLRVQYAHREGPIHFSLLCARGDEALAPVPAWALRPHRIRSVARLMARAALDRSLALSEWVWVGLLVLAAAALARAALARLARSLERACAWRSLIWILAASLVLNAAGIWWGLPGTWVAIELKPVYVLGALSQHSSHGWSDAYPPVHFYVLTAAWSPLLLLSWMDRITFHLEEIVTVEELQQEHPEYVVLNADYARAVPRETGWGQMIAALEADAAGYRRIALFRRASPWPWLPSGHPDLVGARQETVVFSTLRNINPTIEIFQRQKETSVPK